MSQEKMTIDLNIEQLSVEEQQAHNIFIENTVRNALIFYRRYRVMIICSILSFTLFWIIALFFPIVSANNDTAAFITDLFGISKNGNVSCYSMVKIFGPNELLKFEEISDVLSDICLIMILLGSIVSLPMLLFCFIKYFVTGNIGKKELTIRNNLDIAISATKEKVNYTRLIIQDVSACFLGFLIYFPIRVAQDFCVYLDRESFRVNYFVIALAILSFLACITLTIYSNHLIATNKHYAKLLSMNIETHNL